MTQEDYNWNTRLLGDKNRWTEKAKLNSPTDTVLGLVFLFTGKPLSIVAFCKRFSNSLDFNDKVIFYTIFFISGILLKIISL